MADDGGETTPYEWFLYFCRRLVQWAAFFVGGCGTLLIFWFHWGNAYSEYGVKWYEEETAGKCNTAALYAANKLTYAQAYSVRAATNAENANSPPPSDSYCTLDTTTWCRKQCSVDDCKTVLPASKNGIYIAATANRTASSGLGWDCGPLSDNNKDWRKIFTLKPNDFLDMFTPIAIGAIEFLQHLGPAYRKPIISGTWIVRAIWLFGLSLFAQFGYAGDLGVLCGYAVDFAVVLPCIALAILDHESDEAGNSVTTADCLPTLKWLLELCGLEGLCPGLTNVQATVITKDDAPAEEQASA